MSPREVKARAPWWAAVFTLALVFRLGFLWASGGPLVFGHERVYFTKALWIAEHPHPLWFVLHSDAWRSWAGPYWTLPPLYQLFVAGFFRLWGPSLPALQVAQCVMGALTAVGVGLLARQTTRAGAWAGAAYAVYWPAVVMASNTMTENLHTVLLVWAVAMLARVGASGRLGSASAGGFLLGTSALTRTVSAAFLPLAALIHLRGRGLRAGLPGALAMIAACAAAMLPWTARNVLLHGELVLVETVSVYNLWYDNLFVNEDRAARQERNILDEPTASARRQRALALTWRNVRQAPGALPRKAWDNLRYFFRPEGLDNLLRVEYPHPGWLHGAWVLLDDALLLAAVPPFLVFVIAGRPSTARSLILAWSAYYLFMLVVVFHAQLRYRSAWVPFVFAGAAGGLRALAGDEPHRRRGFAVMAVGCALVAVLVLPYVAPAWRAARAAASLASMRRALAGGDDAEAERAARTAAVRDPVAARPYLVYGRLLAARRRPAEALEAYARAEQRRPDHWVPLLVFPQLLREAQRMDEYPRALSRADHVAAGFDPWWALEVAWRELPPPRTNEVLLSRGDYGAVRGFTDGRSDHRWSCGRARLRLQPTFAAPAYAVTLEMGSPPPSPIADPVVSVRVPGAPALSVRLSPEVRPYTFHARLQPGEPLVVELRAPTWNSVGEPPDQGVRVDRMTVAPAASVPTAGGAGVRSPPDRE